jgi:tripartite-type tricarboxylate transporter receptor subunit TctC
LPIKTAKDLIDRSAKKSVLIATSGQGSGEQISTLVIQQMLKEGGTQFNVDFVHYTGTGPSMLGVVKGEAEGTITSWSTGFNLMKSGDLKGLAVFSTKRDPSQPDVPTAKEAGVPRADEITAVLGQVRILVAPPGTSASLANILRSALQKTLADPELLKKATAASLTVDYASAESVQGTVAARLTVANKYKDVIMPIFK